MAEQVTSVRGVDVVYETFGEASGLPLLLIMGLGGQMIWWEDEFCNELVDAGFFVIRFDNRDSGRSQDIDAAPRALRSVLRLSKPAYTLDDMARDAVGVIDAVGLDSAHIMGASMGSMIAQSMAIHYPRRVRSVISMMGTTGALTAGLPQKLKLLAALLQPAATDRNAYIKSTMMASRRLASPAAEFDEPTARRIIELSADRGIHPQGGQRQLAALLTQSDRTKSLRRLNISAIAIHGSADPLIGISGGRATAAAIPGAELLVIDGMGHDFPRFAWRRIIEGVSRTADRGERQRRNERYGRK